MGKTDLLIKDRIKTVCIYMVRVLVRLLYIFPLEENRVVFFSYYGKQYSCNPKAISQYLIDHYPNSFEIYWVFTEPEEYQYLEKTGVKLLKYNSFKRLFIQATAKYTINNCGAFSWIPLRNGQIHCNTWHAGGAYKRLTTGTSYNRNLTAQETTHMVSGCHMFTKHNINDCFNYRGKVLEIGMPRNDIFFDTKKMERVSVKTRDILGIDSSSFMVLYAPTWRYDGIIPHPDFDRIKEAVKKRFNKDAVIVGRSHNGQLEEYVDIIDGSKYPDMQDLLCASDMLITDYSSSIWDYSFTYRPCMLFVKDLEQYSSEQGFLTDIYSWGFPLAKNDDELIDNILLFDEKEFKERMDNHHAEFGSFEHGNATKQFCRELFGSTEE